VQWNFQALRPTADKDGTESEKRMPRNPVIFLHGFDMRPGYGRYPPDETARRTMNSSGLAVDLHRSMLKVEIDERLCL
jgi:hypothetical protein